MKAIIVLNTNKQPAIEYFSELNNYHVIFITEHQYLKYHDSILNVLSVDDISSFDSIRALFVKLIKTYDITAIIPLHEKAILTAAFIRSVYNLPGIKFEAANVFVNKFIMKKLLIESNLPCSSSNIMMGNLENYLNQNTCKVIKPIYGASSIATTILNRNETGENVEKIFDLIMNTDEVFVIEDYIKVINEYHCDSIIVNDEIVFTAISRYFYPVLSYKSGNAVGSYLLTPVDKSYKILFELNKSCLQKLKANNTVTHLEILESEEKIFIGEVACRPAGAGVCKVINHAYKIDLWKAYLDLSIGNRYIYESNTFYQADHDHANAWITLPVQEGKITSLNDVKDFYRIEQVKEVETHVKVGDVIAPPIHSCLGAYTLYFKVDNINLIYDLIKLIYNQYNITYEHQK